MHRQKQKQKFTKSTVGYTYTCPFTHYLYMLYYFYSLCTGKNTCGLCIEQLSVINPYNLSIKKENINGYAMNQNFH